VKGVWNDLSDTVNSFVSLFQSPERGLDAYDIAQGIEKTENSGDALYDLSRDDFRIDEDILQTIQNETLMEQPEAGAGQ
jgi:hypothetical protein